MKYIVYFHYGKGDIIEETRKLETNSLDNLEGRAIRKNLDLLKIEIIVLKD